METDPSGCGRLAGSWIAGEEYVPLVDPFRCVLLEFGGRRGGVVVSELSAGLCGRLRHAAGGAAGRGRCGPAVPPGLFDGAASGTPSVTPCSFSLSTVGSSAFAAVTFGPDQSFLDKGGLRKAIGSLAGGTDARAALTVVVRDRLLSVVYAPAGSRAPAFDPDSPPYDRFPALVGEARSSLGAGSPQTWQLTVERLSGFVAIGVDVTGAGGWWCCGWSWVLIGFGRQPLSVWLPPGMGCGCGLGRCCNHGPGRVRVLIEGGDRPGGVRGGVMQIIEVTGYAVRSAVITMRRAGTPLEFVIFPMLHVASPAFYSQVRIRLRGCDLIVLEGIRGKSVRVRALTLAYRFAPRRRSSGLQEQRDDLLLPEGVPVINPDVTAAEAIADLKTLPRWMYLLLMIGAPVMGLVFALRGPRAFLDNDVMVEDLPSTLEAELTADSPVGHAMTDRRDRRLLDALGEIHAERAGEPVRVAVVYGAGHVPAVVAGLRDRYGYRAREAEWLTVLVAA
ncbi:hypothetical protein ACIQNU_43670 [Streptomyces sp. NPDC091292]|uniref:hypothetical protein n=1 Tax=Streptomyces sp. NPDC091292 TaxID=3365991 RepID=UPI003818871B